VSARERLLFPLAGVGLAVSLFSLGAAAVLGLPGRSGASAWSWLPFILVPPLVTACVAALFAGRLAEPFLRVARAAEQAVTAPHQLTLDLPREDADVTRLVGAVEGLRSALVARIAAVDRERTLLRSVIGRMREALVVVRPDGRVELANEMFRSVCAMRGDSAGRPLAEALRIPAVIDAVQRVLAGGPDEQLAYTDAVSARSFDVQVTAVPVNGGSLGAIALLYDISRLEALERVRREFVANVSHELRTPITSIKAAVETLLDDRCENREIALRFLEISARQVERMEALLADLTDLSLIETEAIMLELVELDAAALVRDVISQHAHLAQEARVTLECDLPASFAIHADRRRLEQILVNLVENAIKFNRPGGRVTVRGRDVEGHPVLEVEDTGVGIPADALEKVFHRFFRVDGAHAERSGTGLGLAIVKHLMRLHGGQVRLDSELGRGSRFTLEFP